MAGVSPIAVNDLSFVANGCRLKCTILDEIEGAPFEESFMQFARAGAAVAVVLVAFGFTSGSAGQTTNPSSPKSPTWSTETGADNQIFPSALISTATSKTPLIFLYVKVSNAPVGSTLKASVRCDSFIEPSSAEAVVKDANPISIPIKVAWKFEKLAAIHQQIPASFVYSLSIDGRVAGEKTDVANVRSVNDCIHGLKDEQGHWKLFGPFFAAYVNEDHPKIDKLLKDALATGIVKKMDAYQSKDPKQVTLQVFAIWEALQLKGMKYSDVASLPGGSDRLLVQRVRFLDESLDNAQANCVDGSVALASVLQRIGIESGLVVTKKHMLIIYYAEAGKKSPVPLETTIMGQIDLPNDPRNKTVIFLDPQWRTRAAAKTFEAAIQKGSDEISKLIEAEKTQKEFGGNDFIDQVISIPEARKAGILPIPFDFMKDKN